MKNFGDAKRRVLALIVEGTEFVFREKKYEVLLSGKPICQ